MPPRVATRSVRLRQSIRASSQTERMGLLTYPMALAQQGATVPLIHSPTTNLGHGGVSAARPLADALGCFYRGGGGDGGAQLPPIQGPSSNLSEASPRVASAGEGVAGRTGAQTLPAPRRWVRDADELCIASIHRSNNINRINSYIATYKFDDPQWRPLLLPEVHLLPKVRAAGADNPRHPVTREQQCAASHSSNPSSSARGGVLDGYDVFIDYSKLTMLELMSRHANYALRHLVQKGHAMYLVNFAQHSVLQMRGLVEASYVSCAYGIRGERLRTHILHTGPVDVREVLEVDPDTLRVSFNFKRPHVRRGVVAVSTVEGYGTWFQRKPMLWQRTRRIGALQSQMGSYDYQLCDSAEVGRLRPYEVSLLAPHVRLIGSQGGADAIALVASSQVAQNERLYMGQFEAPVLTALDAVHQLIHRTALHHQLLRPAVVEETPGDTAAPATFEDPQLGELRRLAGMERFLPVSWVTRTPPPYVPLESDLPFRIQLSRPAVMRTDASGGENGTQPAVGFPTGGSVGSPFVRGVPLSLYEYNLHQGVDHYVFDDAPSARPLKWWNQKSNIPYSGYIYGMRSGLLDYVEPAEQLPNPLAPPNKGATSAALRRSQHRRKRTAMHRRQRSSSTVVADEAANDVPLHAPDRGSPEAEQATPSAPHSPTDAGEAKETGPLNLSPEQVAAGAEELRGYEESSREKEALAWTEDGLGVSLADRPPLHTLVAPTTSAQKRLRRYARALSSSSAPSAGSASAPSSETLSSRTDTLLQRQKRLRLLRRRQRAQGSLPLRPCNVDSDDRTP